MGINLWATSIYCLDSGNSVNDDFGRCQVALSPPGKIEYAGGSFAVVAWVDIDLILPGKSP